MKKTFLFSLLLTISFSVFSQHEFDKWIFGNGTGLDFSSGTPQVMSSGINGDDNSASISDSSGNLLFYSDGAHVYDRFGEMMTHGDGLLGSSGGGQGATIVRKPGGENLYYLFTLPSFAGTDGLRYSIVNMDLNGGKGDVDAQNKNILIMTPSTEKIVPIVHANGVDIWILVHEWQSNVFRSYLLTAKGLLDGYVSSAVGTSHTGVTNNTVGQMSVTRSGDKIACAISGDRVIDVFKFNTIGGVLSDPISISVSHVPLGIEFSPDGSKLYSDDYNGAGLYQYDLSSYNQSDIANSLKNVGTVSSTGGTYYGIYMALGPDDKIYVARSGSKIGRINEPNSLGSACSYDDNAVDLGSKTIDAGLVDKIAVTKPNCVIQVISGITITPAENNGFDIYPNPTDGTVNIRYKDRSFDLKMYDLSGREVLSQTAKRSQSYFNISDYPKGVYVVKLIDTDSGIEISKKVVLQ